MIQVSIKNRAQRPGSSLTSSLFFEVVHTRIALRQCPVSALMPTWADQRYPTILPHKLQSMLKRVACPPSLYGNLGCCPHWLLQAPALIARTSVSLFGDCRLLPISGYRLVNSHGVALRLVGLCDHKSPPSQTSQQPSQQRPQPEDQEVLADINGPKLSKPAKSLQTITYGCIECRFVQLAHKEC